ncbi:hypothetical protein JCM3765_004615 [Sporobolomyces pararoseus]
MSINSLPVETLEQIISSDLEQVDLARLSQVSKLFLIIGRPRLYRSITLYSIRQVDKFNESRQEDAKLVEQVRIIGKENPWEISKMEDLAKAYEAMSETQKQQKVAGVVKRLLEGEIVNPDQLKSVFIHQIVEDPGAVWGDAFARNPKIFANLTDLSIVSYRGGVWIIEDFLKQSYHPNLERLVLCDLVVSSPLNFLGDNPSLLHLTVFSSASEIGQQDKYILVYPSTRASSDELIDAVFAQLQSIVTNFSDYFLKYLALPSTLELQLSISQNKILGDLINLGVAVHFDGDLGAAIAPPSFFGFLKKEKQQPKEEEERKCQELSQE